MKRRHRKPRSERRQREPEVHHWLGEGEEGQEALLLELDPYLVACDQQLATLAASVAHHSEGEGDQRFAVLSNFGWQLGYLTRRFSVYLLGAVADDFVSEAADRFSAKLVSGLHELTHTIDLYLLTDHDWTSEAEFTHAVREARNALSPDGLLCAVLRAEGETVPEHVLWNGGQPTSVQELREGRLFPLPAPSELIPLPLGSLEVAEGELFQSFIKRNRDFFGRNMRDALQLRMLEAEFRQAFQPGKWVMLCCWESNEDYLPD